MVEHVPPPECLKKFHETLRSVVFFFLQGKMTFFGSDNKSLGLVPGMLGIYIYIYIHLAEHLECFLGHFVPI